MSGAALGPDWELDVTLRDGTSVTIAPVGPEDADDIAHGYRGLSPASRFARFHTSSPELSADQLHYLTHVDQDRHVAIGARESATGAGMGVARYVRLPDESEVAEAAVTVADEWQGRGLGSVLLACLAALARAGGVTTFRNYVLADNEPMLRMLRDLGAEAGAEAPGLARLDLPLPADPSDLPDTATGRVFRAVSRRVLEPADRRFPPVYETVREDKGTTARDRAPRQESRSLRDWLDRVLDTFSP